MIILFDTTLRDGLQNSEANMTLKDKVRTFEYLDSLGIQFIEVAWPASPNFDPDIFERCRKVRKQAKIVAFGSTSINKDPRKDLNLLSILQSGADYACIFGKSWLLHVDKQLKITPQENLERIAKSISFLRENKMPVIFDAEHYFDGFKDNKEYAIDCLVAANKAGAEYLIFCDTRGGTLPHEVVEIIKTTKMMLNKRGIESRLGTHFHDDSGVAVANALCTADLVDMIQGTINGLGERVGNLNLVTFAADWVYKMGGFIELDWKKTKHTCEEIWRMAGLKAPGNAPYVGANAFAHKGGVHIDAMNKGASYEHIAPEIFGNERLLLLTTQGGRGSILSVAQKFGYTFDKNDPVFREKTDRLFKRLKHLEDKGYRIEAIPAEQFLLIEEYFGNLEKFFEISETEIRTRFGEHIGEVSESYINGIINGEHIRKEEKVHGGPIYALYHAIFGMLSPKYPIVKNLKINDFHVDLARYHGAQSTVRVPITFSDGEYFTTIGVGDNLLKASKEAIEKGVRYYLQKNRSGKI